MTVALNYQNISNHPGRVNNICPFTDQCNWKEVDFPSHKKDWKKFESSNRTIAFNVLYAPYNSEKIRPAYVSKYNSNRENQIMLLKITDGKKWHYLAVNNILH